MVAAWGPGPLREAVEAAGARYVPLEHVRRPVSLWHDLRGLIELIQLCRRERPLIVHANSSKAGILGRIAARIAGVPVAHLHRARLGVRAVPRCSPRLSISGWTGSCGR